MRRKIWFVIIILTLLLMSSTLCFKPKLNAFATESTSNEQLNEVIEQRIDKIELEPLEDLFNEEQMGQFFEDRTLKETLKLMVTEGKTISIVNVFELIIQAIKLNVGEILKLVALIVAIVGFGGFSELLNSGSKNNNGIASVVNFFILTVILSIVASIISSFVTDVQNLLNKTKSILEVIFPILLSLLVVSGSSSLSYSIQPALIIFTGAVVEVITVLTTTTIAIYLVLSVLSELTENIQLHKLKAFVSSTFKWAIGLVFTVFMGYLSLSGITASGSDRLSVKTAKYAIKSYLPLVGGYVSDSYEIFRVGSVVIKNSIGTIGVLLLLTLIIKRLVTLVLYNLGFKLASGLSEPFGMRKISSFLSSLSHLFNFMIVGVAVCFLLSAIALFIIMSFGNVL